jgi:hypothetical protein
VKKAYSQRTQIINNIDTGNPESLSSRVLRWMDFIDRDFSTFAAT